MSFWTENPDISTLIHDTNNDLARIGYYLHSIEKEVDSKAPNCDLIRTDLDSIHKNLKKLQDNIDYFYTKQRAKYNERSSK